MLKRLVILGLAALAGGVSARYLTAPRAIADPPRIIAPSPLADSFRFSGSAPKFRWEIVWQRPAPGWVAASFSPNGNALAWVDTKGSVRRMDSATGKTTWQTASLRGMNRVSVAPGGTVIAYSYLNPAKPGFRTLDARYGDRKSVMIPVDGAIWNMVALPSGAGEDDLFIATGHRSLYRMPIRPGSTWPGTPIQLPGIADTLDAAGSGLTPTLLLGTWQDGGVGVWGGDRLPRWRQQERDLRRTYQVHLSQDGTTAIATSGIGPHGEKARLHAWDAQTGKLLWIENLYGEEARAALSVNGGRIVVTFRRAEGDANLQSPPSGDGTPGRKIALFDRTGRRLFSDKGGSFFAPELICLSPDGNRITVRDADDVWTFDNRWRRIARLRLPAVSGKPAPRLQQIVPSPDASGLLLITSDGLMTLYKAL